MPKEHAQSFFMPLLDLLTDAVVALAAGFILGYYYVQVQITAIEAKYRADLETWG